VQNHQPKLAIVVASCDKFSDMWEPLFASFFKYWPDCPYSVFLVANHKPSTHPQVTTLLAGDDISWSTTISKSISQLQGYSHILFWIDDAFPTAHVSTQKVQDIFNWMLDNKANFMRLRPNPRPENWICDGYGALAPLAAYRVSLFATIWKVDTLQKILQEGESAWQFEVNGTERSRTMGGFYCTDHEVFTYLHGVERGVWIRPTAQALQKMGYTLDFNRRPVMSFKQNLGHKYRLFKSWVLHLVPETKREQVLGLARSIYKVFGLR
jgi:hypothetical protein